MLTWEDDEVNTSETILINSPLCEKNNILFHYFIFQNNMLFHHINNCVFIIVICINYYQYYTRHWLEKKNLLPY